jgi:uncharacterized Zn finger protein
MAFGSFRDFRPYVPVAERHARARKQVAARMKAAKREAAPVVAAGRRFTRTFWGKAWCENLERYSDFETRLPRGRTYLRNGSVMDLDVTAGKVTALVAGSELYTVTIELARLDRSRWRKVIAECSGRIGSLIGLLRGELSSEVLDVIVRPGTGLFPSPAEIEMHCTCPDWATMCKHVAATLYGVGVRLDEKPELFFLLRQVDQAELVAGADAAKAVSRRGGSATKKKTIAAADLGAIFGIELDGAATEGAANEPDGAANGPPPARRGKRR